MTRRERFKTALAGGAPDRLPRALWHHFPDQDFKSPDYAEATLAFHRRHDMDLLKINLRSSYPIRDYGAQDVFSGDYLGRPRYLNEVVQTPAQWARLPRLDPAAGWLGQTAAIVRTIVAATHPDTPRVLTIFSPMTQARNLAGNARFFEHWRTHPQALRAGLETLCANTVAFLRTLADAPIDGLFYAIQECGFDKADFDYFGFCSDLDRTILGCDRRFWLNVLHLHGRVTDFVRYAAYPVQILHWDETEAGITLDEGRRHFPGLVAGGLNWPAEGWRDERALIAAARAAVRRIGTERVFLGAGCVIPYLTPAAHLDAFCAFDC